MDKRVEFSKHALERITERGASCEFIGNAVNGGVKAVGYPSPKDQNIGILTAKDGEGTYWTAIYSGNMVITVRRAHKSEEKHYDETFR
jgi:hypothetical protein